MRDNYCLMQANAFANFATDAGECAVDNKFAAKFAAKSERGPKTYAFALTIGSDLSIRFAKTSIRPVYYPTTAHFSRYRSLVFIDQSQLRRPHDSRLPIKLQPLALFSST